MQLIRTVLRRLRSLHGSIVEQARAITVEQAPAIKRLDAAFFWRPDTSPIDRHVAIQVATRNDGLFHPSYDPWRATRINKLLEFYGLEWFAGKRVIELGCGHADLGAFFAEIGAHVTSVDGRVENVVFGKLKHRRIQNLNIVHAGLDANFRHFGRFDLMVHFGLLYHLSDIDAHLAQCWGMSDEIMLESVVCDSLDPHRIVYYEGDTSVNEETLNGRQNRPSPFYVERLADENGFEALRCFTRDLNSGEFIYDWVHKDDGDLGGWRKRRMWRLRNRPRE